MADVKISQLPVATTPVDGTEVLPIVQSATTKQVSIANLTAGRAMSASSLTLTTPLAVTSGGTGIATAAQGSLLSATGADTFSATRTPTLGLAGTAAGTLGLSGSTSGVVTLATAATAGTWTFTLPTSGGTNGFILTTNGSGVTTWTNPTALGVDLDVGTTAITGGTTGRVLYNNAGVLGEYSVTGTGSVVLGTTPTFTTSALFPAGTVSAPGISVSGDTNTGIYFPAADTIAFATNGNEDARFDSVGNLLLNSATLSPTQTAAGSIAMTGTLAMGSSFLRNRIINGGMSFWQRGTSYSGTPSSVAYGSVDRWAFYSTSPITASQSTSAPSGFQYSLKLQRPASATTTNSLYTLQVIETVNMLDLAGQSVTLSFYARAGANYSASGNVLAAGVNTGTVADQGSAGGLGGWTGSASPVNGTVVLTTTWTRYSLTGVISASALEMDAYFYYTPTGTAGADDAVYITGVQLEVGSVATPFERRQYGQELALCQRYYWRLYGGSSNQRYGAGYALTTTSANIIMPFPVIMRTAPSALEQSGTASDYLVVYQAAATVCNAVPTLVTCTTAAALTNFSTGVLLTAGNGIMATSNSANSYLGWSAEL